MNFEQCVPTSYAHSANKNVPKPGGGGTPKRILWKISHENQEKWGKKGKIGKKMGSLPLRTGRAGYCIKRMLKIITPLPPPESHCNFDTPRYSNHQCKCLYFIFHFSKCVMMICHLSFFIWSEFFSFLNQLFKAIMDIHNCHSYILNLFRNISTKKSTRFMKTLHAISAKVAGILFHSEVQWLCLVYPVLHSAKETIFDSALCLHI